MCVSACLAGEAAGKHWWVAWHLRKCEWLWQHQTPCERWWLQWNSIRLLAQQEQPAEPLTTIRSGEKGTLVCYCSSYLLLLIACGHRLFFLAQPTPCCLSAQLLSFKCPNVCLAQKHQGRLFISKTKDAVWVASARAEASMPPTSLHICSRNALLFVLLSHCSLNSIRKHFDMLSTHKVHWEQTQLKTSATFSIQSFTWAARYSRNQSLASNLESDVYWLSDQSSVKPSFV